jgi:hypothetical protein
MPLGAPIAGPAAVADSVTIAEARILGRGHKVPTSVVRVGSSGRRRTDQIGARQRMGARSVVSESLLRRDKECLRY